MWKVNFSHSSAGNMIARWGANSGNAMRVVKAEVEDAYVKGAGPRKRVQGSFNGRLAYVSNDGHHGPHIVGRVTK